jgi:hypothetical protein
MNVAMEILSSNHRDALSKISPKAIKSDLAGEIWLGPLTIADAAWRHAPIDIEVGELLILPIASGNGCGLLKPQGEHSGRSIYRAVCAGSGQLDIGGGTLAIRVARQHYIGPLTNRYLDDPDEH